MEQSALKQARRVVVKVGSALLTNDGRGLDRQMIENLAAQICTLVRDGKEVVFVSSGAMLEHPLLLVLGALLCALAVAVIVYAVMRVFVRRRLNGGAA